MEISIIWWNTSLSPAIKPGLASAEDRDSAFRVIKNFITRQIDMICLGEMSPADVKALKKYCHLGQYRVVEGFSKAGRTAFDICVLYRRDTLLLSGKKELATTSGAMTMKVGQRLKFIFGDDEAMYIFVSHWPSRVWCEKNSATRHEFGVLLRQEVQKALGAKHSQHVIVLGDFNDDPFAESLEEHLMASRDRNIVTTRPYLLYNPFWRHMTSNNLYSVRGPVPSYAGTCYYADGNRSNWHTFDQIIFSSSFLGNSDWHLREDKVGIVDIPAYTSKLAKRTERFDHMPVIAAIEKVN